MITAVRDRLMMPAALALASQRVPAALPDPRPLGEKLDDFSRSVRLGTKSLVDKQHRVADASGLHKPWQRLLDRLLPGSLAQAAFSRFQPHPDGDDQVTGPLSQPVDARAWMPRVHFEGGEQFFPIDPGFDGDADVTNNPYTYRRGQTDGNQAPTFFVNGRTVGEYTVITYRTYYVDNQYLNRHHHDWEGFSIYLAKDQQGRLQPAYLSTNWHYHKTLTPWHELELDAQGRPMVTVDRGAHGTRPVRKGMSLVPGATLHPAGYWETATGRMPVQIRLPGDAPGLVGVDRLVPLADGRDPREVEYPNTNWIAGFLKTSHAIGRGPKAQAEWTAPPHPLAFRPRQAVTGKIVATIPPAPAA